METHFRMNSVFFFLVMAFAAFRTAVPCLSLDAWGQEEDQLRSTSNQPTGPIQYDEESFSVLRTAFSHPSLT